MNKSILFVFIFLVFFLFFQYSLDKEADERIDHTNSIINYHIAGSEDYKGAASIPHGDNMIVVSAHNIFTEDGYNIIDSRSGEDIQMSPLDFIDSVDALVKENNFKDKVIILAVCYSGKTSLAGLLSKKVNMPVIAPNSIYMINRVTNVYGTIDDSNFLLMWYQHYFPGSDFSYYIDGGKTTENSFYQKI